MKKLFTFLSRANNNSVGIYLFNHRRVSTIYSMLTLVAIMLMVPQVVKADTYDFYVAATAASNKAQDPSYYSSWYANIVMSGQSYNSISNAQIGDKINYYNGSTKSVDISRFAFVVNTNGVGNAHNDGAGWYLRGHRTDATHLSTNRGLYTGSWGNKFAIIGLNIGDKVTFELGGGSEAEYGASMHYIQSVHCSKENDNDAYGRDNVYFNSLEVITIASAGDLIVEGNKGTYIKSIKIETADVAKYTITTSGNTSTFEFTGNGVLDDNDFSLPYLSFSMGSTDDYLKVENLEAYMIKPNGSETLETNAADYQPSAGSFYTFKPTADGTIEVSGSLTGRVHIFVYDGGWVERESNSVFYRETFNSNSFSFNVKKDKTYYLCINNLDNNEHGYAFHLHWFKFKNSFHVGNLSKVIDFVDNEDYTFTQIDGEDYIELTSITGYNSYNIKTKRCSGNITPLPESSYRIQNGFLYMKKPTFDTGKDNAGTVVIDIKTNAGDATFVATFPYHAYYDVTGDAKDPYRTYGHTWNFIDPRNSDSNIGNCWINDGWNTFTKGTVSGILSIGQYEDVNSQFRKETDNREWIYAQRQTGSSGGFHDPMYKNVWDMVGNNADMIWETEGLIFETSPNLSCLYNEKDAYDQSLTNPVDFNYLGTDPDRYVGLMPPVQSSEFSSFTIPGLKDGDRVLIFMKSGEATGANGIFLNITGAKDALGKTIESDYKAGGTQWQHERYEGCYHFIKNGNGNMKFTMVEGSMAKLLYIRIYQGQRINTNSIVSSATGDSGRLLFMNEKGAELGSDGQGSNMTLRFRGKGQQQKAKVLTCSGNLNYQLSIGKNHKQDVLDDHFTVTGAYYQSVGFTSKVGEIGMFRLREMDVEYSENYVADFSDRNFTVGYRDKVDSYPYTWDFTDIKGFSSTALSNEATNYPIAAAANDEYGDQWEISLFDSNGYMQLNSGFDPITNNQIFSPHKIGNGNQLWAGGDVIPEAKGLWFYSEDDDNTDYSVDYCSSLYNGCMQITTEGIRFANVPDEAGKRVAWWNYKMVVPDVPANGAVYMRMKRDTSVPDNAKTFSTEANADVPFLAARFQFASQSSKTDLEVARANVEGDDKNIINGTDFSYYKLEKKNETDKDEYIVAVKNNTGATDNLTFTLNGWIVEKVAVSKDDKTLNKKGYASESRNRVIDHTLTSFFTGKPIKAYTAESYDAAASTIGLVEITKPMPAATTTAGQNVGSVLYNSDCADADDEDCGKVLDNKFNLFVPDMHDYKGDPNYPLGNPNITNSDMNSHASELQSTTNNLMLSYNTGATSNATIPQKIDGSSVYVLSYQYFEHDKDNLTVNEAQVEAFYRVAKNGAGIKPNSAYLILPVTSSPAKVSFLFGDELFGNQGITTGIEDAVKENKQDSKLEWYSLDGRKLNGAPTAKGLYIVNGRKVLVK